VNRARIPTAVLISGSGTNLQALIDAAQEPDFPAELRLVISNKAKAGGLARAEGAGLETRVLPHRDFADREAFDAALDRSLSEAGIKFVCLAGFMRILTEGFVQRWTGRMLNIHPSLLPAFRGHNAHEQVLESSVALTGCTVHAVTPALDDGPIVAQAAVTRRAEDDLDTLSARVRKAEHLLYPLAIRAFLSTDAAGPAVPYVDGMLLSVNRRVRYAR
jgi:phosphoribosylglycinamide formyltransferase-1